MGKHQRTVENLIHGLFLILGLITVGCVLLITAYLVLSGIPAIREIGLFDFLLGGTWESTAKEPSFGILPFILTSVYGTAGAILLGVPVGFLTAVYLAKLAPSKVKTVVESAVSLLAGIPSVVYGLVGMLILVPGIRKLFHVPDGASLLAAIIVLAVMILPSIIIIIHEYGVYKAINQPLPLGFVVYVGLSVLVNEKGDLLTGKNGVFTIICARKAFRRRWTP